MGYIRAGIPTKTLTPTIWHIGPCDISDLMTLGVWGTERTLLWHKEPCAERTLYDGVWHNRHGTQPTSLCIMDPVAYRVYYTKGGPRPKYCTAIVLLEWQESFLFIFFSSSSSLKDKCLFPSWVNAPEEIFNVLNEKTTQYRQVHACDIPVQ